MMMKSKTTMISGMVPLTLMAILAIGIATPAVALDVSGYYEFERFGDSADPKIIGLGGIGPLDVNQTILTGWRNAASATRTSWWVNHNVSLLTAYREYSATVDLGFDFNYYLSRFNWMKASTNFYMSFEPEFVNFDNSPFANARVVTAAYPNRAIYIAWREGRVRANNTFQNQPGHGILLGRYGTEFGLRNVVLEYYHSYYHLSTAVDADTMTVWGRLYETSNIVELYYWKNISSFCLSVDPHNMEVGMEYGTIGDEPTTDPISPPVNTESWHVGCLTNAGPAFPATHYRFIPVSHDWNDPTYWPEDFEGLTGGYPEFWSVANDGVRSNTWTWHAAGYGTNTTGCMVAEPDSTKEILSTRFIDLSTHPGWPDFTFNHEFVNDNGNNLAELLMTWTTVSSTGPVSQQPWITLWSHSGSNASGSVTVDLPTAGSNRSRAQMAFRYTRTDTPDTIASWDMETDPLWTQGGTAFEYVRTTALASATLHWQRGQGPRNPAGGSWFYALDSGADNDGSYNINADCWLRTTAFNCTGYNYVELNYKRWLGVENHLPASTGDYAYIEVSTDGTVWNQVWASNEQYENVFNDIAWMDHALDLSPWAANQPTVYVRWRLTSDGDAYRFCGWNIDDVSIKGRQIMSGYWVIDDAQMIEGATPTPTITPTPTETPTVTPTPEPTDTPVPTDTPTPTNTPTSTPTPSNTPTNTPTWTPSPTQEPTTTGGPTVTPTPAIQLNCLSAIPVYCGHFRTCDPAAEGFDNVQSYVCLPSSAPPLDGNEMIFEYVAPQTGAVTARITTANPTNHNLIAMRLNVCSENANCNWTYSNMPLDFWTTAGLTYYIVVDMPIGLETPFTIYMDCDGIPPIPTTSRWGLIAMILILGGILFFSSRRVLKQKN